MALAPYLNLPQEIESLRTVIDMRTEEIQKLRRQNMDLEKQVTPLLFGFSVAKNLYNTHSAMFMKVLVDHADESG